jgi:hypothetical protein
MYHVPQKATLIGAMFQLQAHTEEKHSEILSETLHRTRYCHLEKNNLSTIIRQHKNSLLVKNIQRKISRCIQNQIEKSK